MDSIGQLLKKLRENHPRYSKYSQDKFATKILKTAPTWYNQIENDKQPAGNNLLSKIAAAFDVPYLWLLIIQNKQSIGELNGDEMKKTKSLISLFRNNSYIKGK